MKLKRLVSLTDYFNYKRIKRKTKQNPHSEKRNWALRKEILTYYSKQKINDPSLRKAISYIRKEGVTIFPYSFADNYNSQDVVVYEDDGSGLRYVLHGANKLYFPEDLSVEQIQSAYSGLSLEQDASSPHRYLSDDFDVESGSVLIDVGAAEGILSLSVIEKVHKLFLLEMEERWIKALEKTFEPWKDKVSIINKYASNKNGSHTITIDSLLDEFDVSSVFLKLDVEGAEAEVLEGSVSLLGSCKYDCRVVVCTYHKQDDYHKLSAIMEALKYKVMPSEGYMLFILDSDLGVPYFRKGLIRCLR